MEYRTIFTIKESEKATVMLADVAGINIPVVVKCLQGVKPDIYRLFCHAQNPHIPQVYLVEEQENGIIVAEEYVDGENLEEYLEENKLTDDEKLGLALQLCEAVDFLHSMEPPVLHRDIKPSNILVTGKGMLKLIDFDASRQYKGLQSSGDTRLLGTVEYAPPEQFGYSQTDVRSDIYSMGVVFHGLHLSEDKKTVELWARIVEKCTSFDPKNRYQSVPELVKEIQKLKSRKIKRKRAVILSGAVAVITCILAILAFGIWQEQSRETEGDQLELTPTSSPTATVSPIPTSSPTATVSPILTPSPEPTATWTPTPEFSPTLEPTPTPTLEPTLVPTPISTPTPTLISTPTPTVTPSPSISTSQMLAVPEKLLLWAEFLETPSKISASKYNYYKAEAENAELIFYNDVAEENITFIGGMCYQYETEEYIYIPADMLFGGPNYYGVSDEFLSGLKPGLYFFYIARETEDGQGGFMGKSAEIHSEEKRAPQSEHLLIDVEEKFYSEYQKEAVFVVWCDVLSRINGLYTMKQNSEKEAVDASGYDIAMDGKVLLINKEFLARYPEKESVFFTVTFDDGKAQEIEVKMIEGLPAKVSPTPSPTPTPAFLTVPETINQYFYRGLAEETELILRHGWNSGRQPSEWYGTCYNYRDGTTVTVSQDMIDIGAGYIRILDDFLLTLAPSVYELTLYFYSESGGSMGSTERTLQVYTENAMPGSSRRPFSRSKDSFDVNAPRDFMNDIGSYSTNRFTGVAVQMEGMDREAVEEEWYEILCDGKVLILKKEYLLQYAGVDKLTLTYFFDDGRQFELELFYEGDENDE